MTDSVVLDNVDGFDRLRCGVAVAFVGWIREGDRDDFCVEEAGFLSFGCAIVGCGAEGVLISSADVVSLGYVLACYAHWHDAIPCVFHCAFFQLGPQLRRHSFRTVVPRHAFHAGADAHVYAAYGNSVGDGSYSLEAGCAGTIDSVERCAGRVADVIEGHAGSF